MGELDKQEAQKAMRLYTLKSKGAQPETQIKVTSDTPPKIEAQPHENSVGTWLSATISKRKTTHKTTAKRPPTQTTIGEFYLQEDNEDNNESEPKRPKSEKHAFTTSVQERVDYNEETINLIDETMNMCRKETPGSIAMIVDSGASHIACIAECHLQHLQKLRNNSMCKARSKDHCYWNWITYHRMVPPPRFYLSRRRITALFTRIETTHGERMHCRVYRQIFQIQSYGLPSTCTYRIQISTSHIMTRQHTTGAASFYYE